MQQEHQHTFGLGAGECGLGLLKEILSRQPDCHATLAQPPLLPWSSSDPARLIRERLARTRSARLVADCASFYLPYVEEAIAYQPEVRFICLKRPEREAISGLCQQLDRSFPRAINPWTIDIDGPWSHDFLWARSYPQWEIRSRFEGGLRYWNEYYERVDELCARYPENIRVWDTEQLTRPEGVREVLRFAGFPPEKQVLVQGQRKESQPWTPEEIDRPRPHRFPNPADPRRCVILVPYQGLIHAECEGVLKGDIQHSRW